LQARGSCEDEEAKEQHRRNHFVAPCRLSTLAREEQVGHADQAYQMI